MHTEWKATVIRYGPDLQSNKKVGRDEVIKLLRDKASNIHKEYLAPSSAIALNIDSGLIETINIRLTDPAIVPDPLWFESICKYVYEKIKNEDIFLTNFYQSSSYRKLLLELEFYSNLNVDIGDLDSQHNSGHSSQQPFDTGSDSNSGDLIFDDEIDFVSLDGNSGEYLITNTPTTYQKISPKHQFSKPINEPFEHHAKVEKQSNAPKSQQPDLLDVIGSGVSKHYRSHSDCTGLVQDIEDFRIGPFERKMDDFNLTSTIDHSSKLKSDADDAMKNVQKTDHPTDENVALICPQHRLSAKIINTAINCEGQFAVYAIHVTVIEDNQQKSWHVYRRYSRFLDLKKLLVRRVSYLTPDLAGTEYLEM